MSTGPSHLKEIFTHLAAIYDQLPFNRVLGLKLADLSGNGGEFRFDMRSELVGNTTFGILHGGVIASVLDVSGGFAATIAVLQRNPHLSLAEMNQQIARVGTIDLRIDYLRPGKGAHFIASSTIMRTGKRVAVTRMELTNQDARLIAVGTGTYILS